MPTLNARCWRTSRWMSKTSPSGGNWRLVTDGGTDQHHHRAALGHGLAVELHIARHVPGHMRCGWFQAQQLLDRLGDQRRVLDEFTALVGVFGQHLARPADQSRGGLVACARDDVEVDQQFLASEPPGRSRLVNELRVEQFGHDVVRRILDAPVDIGLEEFARGEPAVGLHGLAGLGAHRRVGRVRGPSPGRPREFRAAH